MSLQLNWVLLRQFSREHIDQSDPSHDWSHIMRVCQLGVKLARAVDAREDIVLAACYLHDLINLPKNHPERESASRQSAQRARTILGECGFGEPDINAITLAIEEHSYSRGLKPSTLESAVLQDADRLDALGAIGVMRTVTCGARMGAGYYSADDPFGLQRELDDRRWTLDHFERKLLRLEAGFNTEPGRQMARQRTQFMREFLAQLGTEIEPEGMLP